MQKISYYLIVSMLFLGFTQGLLEAYAISSTIVFIVMNIEMTIVIILSLVPLRKIYIIPAALPIFLLFAHILISFFMNDVTILHLIFFIKMFFLPILFFIALFNIKFSIEEKEKLMKWVIILFFTQIPASFVKIYLFGFQEDYTGSISIEGGSISTILTTMAVSFIISYSMVYKKPKTLFLLPFFILIAIASSKLGVFLYVFTVVVLLYGLQNKILQLKTLIAIIIIMLVTVISLYTFVVMTPRVNPDNAVGGRFDLKFALDWVEFYTSRDKGAEGNMIGVARKDAPAAMLKVMNRYGSEHILFGFGPGDLILSSYLPYDNPIVEKYNMGYGARIGLVWTGMQLGLVGVFFYLWFHLLLLLRMYKKYKKSQTKKIKMFTLGMIGVSMMFFIDFFTYSPTLVNQPAMVASYFIVMYYAFSLEKIEKGTNVS